MAKEKIQYGASVRNIVGTTKQLRLSNEPMVGAEYHTNLRAGLFLRTLGVIRSVIRLIRSAVHFADQNLLKRAAKWRNW